MFEDSLFVVIDGSKLLRISSLRYSWGVGGGVDFLEPLKMSYLPHLPGQTDIKIPIFERSTACIELLRIS